MNTVAAAVDAPDSGTAVKAVRRVDFESPLEAGDGFIPTPQSSQAQSLVAMKVDIARGSYQRLVK